MRASDDEAPAIYERVTDGRHFIRRRARTQYHEITLPSIEFRGFGLICRFTLLLPRRFMAISPAGAIIGYIPPP